MSSSVPNHSTSNDNDSEFYDMVGLRLSHYIKHGEDHPDYVDNFDDHAHQEQLLPATDDVAQLYAFDLAYQRRFLPVVDAAAQVDRVGPLLTHEALPIADQNDPQRSDLNARTVTGSEQVNTGDEIQEGTHLCHVPSVVDMDYGQHSPSPAGTGDERSLASASGATQGRVEPTQMSKPRKDSQVEGKSRAKVVQKGEVRDSPTGRGIEYKDLRTGVWSPAIRHADIRESLLKEADHTATVYGGYDFPPAKGLDSSDRTAFVPEHKTWGPDRANRPEINFVFDKPKTPLPVHVKPNTKPRDWVWHGFIVLDHNDKPMRDFDDCPTTLASCVEGFRIDAILKRNSEMETLDLWGRLPPHHTATRFDDSLKVVPIVTIAGLNTVAMRWRYEACILSFTRRLGSDDTRNFLSQFLTHQQLDANTTRGREDLTKAEVAELFEYKRAAESARRKGQAAPKIARRIIDVEAPPVVSPHAALATQSAARGGPLISHAEWAEKRFSDSVEYGRASAAGLSIDQVKSHRQKRQFDEAINSRDLSNSPPEASGFTSRDPATSNYRPILPLKHTPRTLQSSVNEDLTTNYLSPKGQQYHQGGTKALTSFSSPDTVEGPPAKRRWVKSRVDGSITQQGPQERGIGLAQGPRPDLGINSSAGSNARYDRQRALPHPNNHILPNGGQIEGAYPDRLDPPPMDRRTVPPGFRHVMYPVGTAVTIFCPDDIAVWQGIITGGEKTRWHKETIPDTIRTLQEMDASQGLPHSVPSEVFRNVQTSANKPLPTEPYIYNVPEGFEPVVCPIGKKVVCVCAGTKKILAAIIAADGPTPWRSLSPAATINLLKAMEARSDSLQ